MTGNQDAGRQAPDGTSSAGPVPGNADVARTSATRGRKRLMLKIVVPLAIFAAAGVGAWGVYQHSSHAELPAPSYATLVLQSRLPLELVTYTVTQDQEGTAIGVDIRVHVGALAPGGPQQTLEVIPPDGIGFFKCLSCAASASQTGSFNEPVHLLFTPVKGSGLEEADVSYLAAAGFGHLANGLDASAAIPQVSYQCPTCPNPGTPQLKTDYYLPGADRYNWAPAFEFRSGDEIRWAEPVVPDGETPGSVATGIDLGTQQWDNTLTFFAGALVGVAGGALLNMVTEVLHARDDG